MQHVHLQLTNVRSGKSTKRYARLVQSYRRPDGMPAQKVIANLGELSDQQVHNLRIALQASRDANTLVLPDTQTAHTKVIANLAFLDVAVALDMWRSWKLSELLQKLIPEQRVAVKAAQVICTLTIQRCVAPGSKLYAQRWFPKTALPELLGIAPAHMHNTRIHRVLQQLDIIETELQEALTQRYQQRDGCFATLFTDVTDTWFEGRGPDLAERNRTKEGLTHRHKIGILLLCNEHGYPLRWSTLAGRTQDNKALCQLVDTIRTENWAHHVPIIFDRAMGSSSAVARLCNSQLRFVTAVRRNEIQSYTDKLPSHTLTELGGSNDEPQRNQLITEAARRVEQAGMQKVDDSLYVLDLGIASRKLCIVSDEPLVDTDPESLQGGALWLYHARAYRTQLENKTFKTQLEIAKNLGVTRNRMTQIMTLLRLDETLQKQVLSGNYGPIDEHELRAIAKLRTKQAQRRALLNHAATTHPMGPLPRRFQRNKELDATLRLILYFNPQMFIDMRTTADRHRLEVESYVSDLNMRLRHKGNRATYESVYADISGKLSRLSMLSLYKVHIESKQTDGYEHLMVTLTLDESAWNKHRRTDGFVLLVAHSELSHTAQQLVSMVRAKDSVEKNFQTIKSDLRLRPVFHHTDPKVRAHVSLCMLALLLERTLERRMGTGDKTMTAPSVFEELCSCHLNMMATEADKSVAYVATELTTQQREILRRLRLGHLVELGHLASCIKPREVPSG